MASGDQRTPTLRTILRLDTASRASAGGRRRSASVSGRENTSPTIVMLSTRSRLISRHTRSGSSERDSENTTVPPPTSAPMVPNSPVECINGGSMKVCGCVPALRAARAAAANWSKSVAPPALRDNSARMSRCRHSTAFGNPVVPPVNMMS